MDVNDLWELFLKESAKYLSTPAGPEKERLQVICDLLIVQIKLALQH
jgi:hypothetical protein